MRQIHRGQEFRLQHGDRSRHSGIHLGDPSGLLSEMRVGILSRMRVGSSAGWCIVQEA